MQLQDFLNKAKTKKANEKKVVNIEIKELGAVEFIRPKHGDILDFMDKTDKGDESVKEMMQATYEMLYLHCPVLQSKELRDEFKPNSPYDLVPELFGITQAGEILEKFMAAFDMGETEKKIDEEVKK